MMNIVEQTPRPVLDSAVSTPGSESPVVVSVTGLEKRFRRENGEWTSAVDGVSLDIHAGELVVVLGSSGCGKTTMLRCIAGLERPTGGEIRADGKLISSAGNGVVVPPERRNFGMMFQSYAVWPHMSVFKNVAYALNPRTRRAEIERRVSEVLELVGIAHLRDEYSGQLSGGQQQRIALARCLVADPRVILFDEPLSNVDAKVREDLRTEILAMKERIGFGGLYVTHDQEEAMGIADRIAVMDQGRIVQIGTPREIYGRPQNLFVARFVGSLSSWRGTVRSVFDKDGLVVVSSELGEVRIAPESVAAEVAAGDEVWVSVRPEELELFEAAPPANGVQNVWKGVIRKEVFRGTYCECVVESEGVSLRVRVDNKRLLTADQEVFLRVSPQRLRALPVGTVSPRGEVR